MDKHTHIFIVGDDGAITGQLSDALGGAFASHPRGTAAREKAGR